MYKHRQSIAVIVTAFVSALILILLLLNIFVLPQGSEVPDTFAGQRCKNNRANILRNGNFESRRDYWEFLSIGSGKFTVDRNAPECSRAAKIILEEPDSQGQLYQKPIRLQPNTQYKLTFAAYAPADATFYVSLLKHDSPYTNYGLHKYTVNPEQKWSYHTVLFMTPNTPRNLSNARLRFTMMSDTENSTFGIDDVIIQKDNTPPSPPPPIAPTCIPLPSCALPDADPQCTVESPLLSGGAYCPMPTCIPMPPCMLPDANPQCSISLPPGGWICPVSPTPSCLPEPTPYCVEPDGPCTVAIPPTGGWCPVSPTPPIAISEGEYTGTFQSVSKKDTGYYAIIHISSTDTNTVINARISDTVKIAPEIPVKTEIQNLSERVYELLTATDTERAWARGAVYKLTIYNGPYGSELGGIVLQNAPSAAGYLRNDD